MSDYEVPVHHEDNTGKGEFATPYERHLVFNTDEVVVDHKSYYLLMSSSRERRCGKTHTHCDGAYIALRSSRKRHELVSGAWHRVLVLPCKHNGNGPAVRHQNVTRALLGLWVTAGLEGCRGLAAHPGLRLFETTLLGRANEELVTTLACF